jgi:hypothetical protein
MARNPNAMDVSDDGYETDDTIIVGDGDDGGYTSDEIRQINEYYDQLNDQITLTPPRTNRHTNANANTPGTPPTRLLTNNTQMPGQVYKMVIEPDGTLRLVPFTSNDYTSGQQPFDITGRAINRDELPHIRPRKLFGEEKEGGASKSRRRRTKKSLRKRRSSHKRKTNKRRKTRSKK